MYLVCNYQYDTDSGEPIIEVFPDVHETYEDALNMAHNYAENEVTDSIDETGNCFTFEQTLDDNQEDCFLVHNSDGDLLTKYLIVEFAADLAEFLYIDAKIKTMPKHTANFIVDGDLVWEQLRALFTAYCLHNNIEKGSKEAEIATLEIWYRLRCAFAPEKEVQPPLYTDIVDKVERFSLWLWRLL